MTNPIQIGDETFAPNIVPCPIEECDAEIDAQAALYGDGCPACGNGPEALCRAADSDEPLDPPEEEHESHKLNA